MLKSPQDFDAVYEGEMFVNCRGMLMIIDYWNSFEELVWNH